MAEGLRECWEACEETDNINVGEIGENCLLFFVFDYYSVTTSQSSFCLYPLDRY